MNASRDSADPYSREDQIFPVLHAEEAARIERFGRREHLAPGAVLFSRGDRLADFFVVREGTIGIYTCGSDGCDHLLTSHRAGQFTGELDHFSARALLVSARAIEPACVIRVGPDGFRRLIAAEPDIGEVIIRAFILRRMGFIHHGEAGVTLIGAARDGDTLRLERFAIRNGYPLRLLEPAEAAAREAMAAHELAADALPAVVFPGGLVLSNPSTPEFADSLGLTSPLDPDQLWDVAVVGAGPSGLAAATYAASEGLATIVVEELAPGGQAGTSSRIENYLGFPTGISGQALAGRAQVQAQKFGARIAVSRRVTRLDCSGRPFRIVMEDEQVIRVRSLVIASGARYRRLVVPELERFEGQGVHYAATPMEATLCRNEEVVVVGAGNSAGQAAVFLSGHARHVHMVVRGAGLASTMSDYLVQRIGSSERITLYVHSEITALEGDRSLERIVWRSSENVETRVAAGNLFVMIGAEPNTDWLYDCLPLDPGGFVLTGRDGAASPYETDVRGIFAVGDVRAGSIKRVAAGVGEGSVVIQQVHRFLEEERARGRERQDEPISA